ncbi:MAG: dihydrofolate reductase [Planctomycetota bacterium]
MSADRAPPPRTAIIVAMTRQGLLGRGNSLPWSWPEDLRHFQRTTRGHAVVMGRKTFDSLHGQFGGPLKGRTNVVVSKAQGGAGPDGLERDGARWFATLSEALSFAARTPPPPPAPKASAAPAAATNRPVPGAGAGEQPLGMTVPAVPGEVFVLGGAEIFRLALTELRPAPQRLIITWVPEVPAEPGDTFFPFQPAQAWVKEGFRAVASWHGEGGVLEYGVYERRPG